MVCRPPGPKARQWLREDRRHVSPSAARAYPLVAVRAQGMAVEDADGNRYLDFTAGVAVCATGHGHPRVVEAVTRQAQRLIHMSGADFHPLPGIQLAQRLCRLMPGRVSWKVFFSNSGAEAVEAAVKLVRFATRRPYLLAFHRAFHGRTLGALSLTNSRTVQRAGFAPLLPGVIHVPYAYCYRCPYRLAYPGCRVACVTWIEEELFRTCVPPEEVAAVFVEPILGEGGCVVPPDAFLRRLRSLTRKYGILLVVDEVQTGMGRTGRLLAVEHVGVRPDVVAVAKGIASGLPLGATLAPSRLMGWGPGSHASTFGGNPLACAAAMATLDLLEQGLLDNARVMGQYLLEGLQRIQREHPLVGDVRGRGLMVAIELVRDPETREPAAWERDRVVRRCFERGLLVLGAGASAVRMVPPLIVTEEDVDAALTLLDEAVTEVERGMRRGR